MLEYIRERPPHIWYISKKFAFTYASVDRNVSIQQSNHTMDLWGTILSRCDFLQVPKSAE
jgi:hypothetical protein